MKKILVLGSKGMLGQELVREFQQAGYTALAHDRDTIDITVQEQCAQLFEQVKPEIVINAAAYNAVDKIEESENDFDIAKKINADAPGTLARLCYEHGATFVHYSSDYVFSGNKEDGYDENAAVQPVNKYGETKAIGEGNIIDTEANYYIIRLSKLFGKTAISEGAKKSFVDTMLWLATEGGKTHIDLVDEEKSCPTYAPDLSHFTRLLIESDHPKGIYHGANSGACTWYEFAQKIFALKNITIDTTPVSGDKIHRPAKRPMNSELLNTKLPAQRSWKEALEEYLR